MLIGWISTEVRLFGYLQNIVLVVCFLGMGVGFFSSKRPSRWSRSIISQLLLALLFVIPPLRVLYRSISGMLAFLHDYVIWGAVMPGLDVLSVRIAMFLASAVASLVLMIMIAQPFIPLGRRIPVLYILFGFLTALLLFRIMSWNGLSIRRFVEEWDRSSWHFFFLGAGFLLLEVQNISKASVALGNTWLVSAVIINGVLGMILLANLVVLKRTAIEAVTPAKDHALGANLWGALVGAGLQSVSFLFGIRFLLVLVLGFYVLALLSDPLSRRSGSSVARES